MLFYFASLAHTSFAQSSIIDITTYSDIVTDGDNSVGSGDVVVFTTTVKNISNISISNFTITNTLVGVDGTSLTLSSPITFVGNLIASFDLNEKLLIRPLFFYQTFHFPFRPLLFNKAFVFRQDICFFL